MNEKRERGTGRIFQRGSTWWIQYYVHGQQIRVSAETTDPKRAARFLRKRIGEVEAGIHKDTRRLTYEELREVYYQDYAVNQRIPCAITTTEIRTWIKWFVWMISSRAIALRRSART